MDANNVCFGCFNSHNGEGPCPHCGYDLKNAVHPFIALPIGTILNGRYLTGRVLGVGGFGVTYLALDMTLEIPVAVKEFLPSGIALRDSDHYTMTVTSPEEQPKYNAGATRFLDEARLLAKLRDVPNIVTVQDYFRENNTAYFVMEYIEGVDLMKYTKTKGGKLSYDETLRLCLPIIDSLAHVHAHNLLHRDISPDNIVVMKNGSTRLLDFGAARLAVDTEKSKSIILKHGFAPEEQYRKHGNQGPWSDEYALAATMYLILTGVMPPDALERVHEDTLVPPIKLGVDMPQYANDALMKALAVSASDRFPDMSAFYSALTGETITTPVAAPAQAVSSGSNSDALPTASSVNEGEMVGGKTVAMNQDAAPADAPEKLISPSILANEKQEEVKPEPEKEKISKPKQKKSIWKRPLTYVLIGLIALIVAAVPTGIYISQNYEWVAEEEETTKHKTKETTKKTKATTEYSSEYADPDIESGSGFNEYTDDVRNFSLAAPVNYKFENKDGLYCFTRDDDQCEVYVDFISQYMISGNLTRISNLNDFVAVSNGVIYDYVSNRIGYTDLSFKFDTASVYRINDSVSLLYDGNAYDGDKKVDFTFLVTESRAGNGVFISCGVMNIDEYGMYSEDDWNEIESVMSSLNENTSSPSKYALYEYAYSPYFSFLYNTDTISSIDLGKTASGLDCLDCKLSGLDSAKNSLRVIYLGALDDITAATDLAEKTLGVEYKLGGYTPVTPTVRTSTDMRIRNYKLYTPDEATGEDVEVDATCCVLDLSGQYFAVVAISDTESMEAVALDFTMIVRTINNISD